jgi:hypothetical protein
MVASGGGTTGLDLYLPQLIGGADCKGAACEGQAFMGWIFQKKV